VAVSAGGVGCPPQLTGHSEVQQQLDVVHGGDQPLAVAFGLTEPPPAHRAAERLCRAVSDDLAVRRLDADDPVARCVTGEVPAEPLYVRQLRHSEI
jgi:hypothetical protein